MVKIRIIKYIGIVLFALYIVVIALSQGSQVLGGMDILLFSILLASVSLVLCFKGAILKSYSTLWFALSLILYAILIILFEVGGVTYEGYGYLFAYLPILASIIMLIMGKVGYLKVIILNISIALPVSIIYNISMGIWLKLGIILLSFIMGVFISKGITFDKEKI